MYVCNRQPLPHPMTIEWFPACAGGDCALVRPRAARGERVKEPIAPIQRTAGMSAHTHSRVTSLGRIPEEL